MRDAKQVENAQRGDAGSREALARAWLPRAYAVALAITGRAAEAEDLTQEAFYRAFRRLSTLRDPARFGPWLLRIVRNAAKDVRRKPDRPRSLGDAERELPAPSGEVPASGALEAWRGLPEDQRLVCWLKIVDGLPLREIATLLDTSKSAVFRTWKKGIERLRKEMARCRTART